MNKIALLLSALSLSFGVCVTTQANAEALATTDKSPQQHPTSQHQLKIKHTTKDRTVATNPKTSEGSPKAKYDNEQRSEDSGGQTKESSEDLNDDISP